MASPVSQARLFRTKFRYLDQAEVFLVPKDFRENGDAISARIAGKLADNRGYEVELSADSFDSTTVRIRVAPRTIFDSRVVGGDEASAAMLLQLIRVESGLKADGRKPLFFGWF